MAYTAQHWKHIYQANIALEEHPRSASRCRRGKTSAPAHCHAPPARQVTRSSNLGSSQSGTHRHKVAQGPCSSPAISEHASPGGWWSSQGNHAIVAVVAKERQRPWCVEEGTESPLVQARKLFQEFLHTALGRPGKEWSHALGKCQGVQRK